MVANMDVYAEGELVKVCPECGSSHVVIVDVEVVVSVRKMDGEDGGSGANE